MGEWTAGRSMRSCATRCRDRVSTLKNGEDGEMDLPEVKEGDDIDLVKLDARHCSGESLG